MSAVVIDSLKRVGKRIWWVHALNGHLKSHRLKREYNKIFSHYSSLPSKSDHVARLHRKLVDKFPSQGHRLKVFFLGTDELQDRNGILQAIDRLGVLSFFTRTDGSYGQNFPGSEKERRLANSDRLLTLFKGLAETGRTPDILLMQTWAGYVDPKVLEIIRQQYGTIIVNIAMDDRHQFLGRKVHGEWWGTRGLIPYLDLALTAAPECVEWYEKEGCPALFFPEASDPEIFHPMPELPKLHDVCFVGARYGIREKIVEAIRRAGIRVTAHGAGWESGRLGTNDVPQLFAQSKIVLGVGTVGHCEDFYALKMRDFDGPMSGSFYLTHDNPDLYPLYIMREEIDTYRSIQECVEKVKTYLVETERRERIAAAGRKRAVQDHTWDHRFADLLSVLRGTGTAGIRKNLVQIV